MAYTPSHQRQVLADEFLNSIYTSSKNHRKNIPEQLASGSYKSNSDRSKSDPEAPKKHSPPGERRPVTSVTSPISATPINPGSPSSVKTLTCYFWATHGRCKWADSKCLYAHYHTGKIASGPVQVEEGKPPVAGRNASNPHPVYQDWRREHLRANETGIHPELQRQLDHIKAKAIQNSTRLQMPGLSNHNIMTLSDGFRISEPVNNRPIYHNRTISPTDTRQPSQRPPNVGHIRVNEAVEGSCQHAQYSSEPPYDRHTVGESQQPPKSVPIAWHPGPNQAAGRLQSQSQRDNVFFQPVHQMPLPNRQVICPCPGDHLIDNYNLRQTMHAKDLVISKLAEVLDATLADMELYQHCRSEETMKLIELAKIGLTQEEQAQDKNADAMANPVDTESHATGWSSATAATSAQKRKLSSSSLANSVKPPHIPTKTIGVAENLLSLSQKESRTIKRLKATKEQVAIDTENVG